MSENCIPENVKNGVKQVIAARIDELPEIVNLEATLESLGFDSIGLVEVSLCLKDHFSIKLKKGPTVEDERVVTVKSLCLAVAAGLDVKARVNKIVAEHVKKDPGSIRFDHDLEAGLGLDSLGVTDLVLSLENEFGIEIKDEALDRGNKELVDDALSTEALTVGDINQMILNLLPA